MGVASNPEASAARATEPAAAELAKAALRRLALERKQPTPENFAWAYRTERGDAPGPAAGGAAAVPDGAEGEGEAWAALIQSALRGVERGGRNWTAARRKDSLQRVLGGSRSDAKRLQQRLKQLIASWDSDALDEAPSDLAPFDVAAPVVDVGPMVVAEASPAPVSTAWSRVAAELGATVQAALPTSEARSREVAERLAQLQARVAADGPDGVVEDVAQACTEAQRVLQHRQHLMNQLGGLCQELTEGLADLSEDDSWVKGQCEVMRSQLFESDGGLTARGVRSVSQLLLGTRERQQELRAARKAARDALKDSIHEMLDEIASLGAQTGRFSSQLDGYADEIDRAESLESLAGTVRQMVAESRAVHEGVSQAQARLALEHSRSAEMQARVVELEDEIRRLSDEVSTDPLTQIANRRGLQQAFETEQAKNQRAAQGEGGTLAVALIDIDNFKKLNDRLGHASGDAALQFLTHRVAQALRPGDTLARYGGEEFVVLLPGTPLDEAQRVLTRVQRTLSAELFMSDEQGQVFVTFSAGVSLYRPGERLEQSLERADEALYEAKHSGKNRTCAA